MIEVNLYSVPTQDPEAMVGRCVARARFNKEGMGVSIMEFVKGFLRDNLGNFETQLANANLVAMINDSYSMSRKDFACINYCLQEVGYKVVIVNVADDEENPTGVPAGSPVEWNIIDRNFLQFDYPTATKFIPGDGSNIPAVLRQIVAQVGLFDSSKFVGVANPFNQLLDALDRISRVNGSVSPGIVSKIYNLLSRMGIEIFCAASEN